MNRTNKLWAPRLFSWLGILASAALLFFFLPRHHYYFSSPAQRIYAAENATLRSSGYCGLAFGALSTFLIFLNLSYLLRKELMNWHWLGNLRSWMSFHVTTGLVAALFVLLHAGFLLRSALGSLALIAFGVVVLTGVVGRYVYSHTPRSLEGSELEIDEVRSRLKMYRGHLEKLGLPPSVFQTIVESSKVTTETRGVLSSLMAMVAGDRQLWRTYDALKQTIQRSPTLRPLGPQILPLARRYYTEVQWLSRFHELRGFMSTWRFFHRWLAILMVASVVFHILVAAQMGNLWIFDAHRVRAFEKFARIGIHTEIHRLRSLFRVVPLPPHEHLRRS